MSRQSDPVCDDRADHIDDLQRMWAAELPDLDTSGMTIIGRMRRLTLALRPGIEAIFESHGLDAGEFDVIATLRRSGPPYRLRPTELYRQLMVSSGGLTDRLSRLEKAGLITRAPAPDDGRSLLVQLTDEGVRRSEAALRQDMTHEAGVISALSAAERKQLAALLRKLALAIGG